MFFPCVYPGICSIKYISTVDLGTLNTFDGTDPKVNTQCPEHDFFPCVYFGETDGSFNERYANLIIRQQIFYLIPLGVKVVKVDDKN